MCSHMWETKIRTYLSCGWKTSERFLQRLLPRRGCKGRFHVQVKREMKCQIVSVNDLMWLLLVRRKTAFTTFLHFLYNWGFADLVTFCQFKRRVQESTQILRELEISLRTNYIGWVSLQFPFGRVQSIVKGKKLKTKAWNENFPTLMMLRCREDVLGVSFKS